MEHDQRFKTLLRTFFADFLRLFFARWAARFDLSRVEWLDKELMGAAPESPVHVADLLASVQALQAVDGMREGEKWLILVHIEIDSNESATRLREKMPRYYWQLRATYGVPVLPIALFLRMNLEGVGEEVVVEKFWELEVDTFRFLRVGLLGLDAVEYVQGDNWLGVALSALMKIPSEKVVWLGAEALRRISGAPLEYGERVLLAECVQAYLPLEAAQKNEFHRLLESEPYTEVRAMNKTAYENGFEIGIECGIERGIERGQMLGQQKLALAIYREKFGAAPTRLCDLVGRLSEGKLQTLVLRISAANSPEQVDIAELEHDRRPANSPV